ncbi:hypothetical protein [Paraburkholderia metrosideri]|uniref:Antitoxin Xre/MbcA/ParS-like toxin-binding domain-containing protein n=1 Tax=Paraburkholderia metrosideri TaxID=580937 RepID=A0ABM8NU04_9BURK|nr:hypothetical protein [Paraburkholderia metrosideri]CAD6543382.1 hypothetical protein LMG28140_03912 [Paraburkholderia metrosideri]
MRTVTATETTEPEVPNKKRTVQSLEDARVAQVNHAIHRAVVTAILVDPVAADAFLDIPDEELGRRFKNRLWEVIGVSTILNLDLRSMREEEANLAKHSGRGSKLRISERNGIGISERYTLVREGRLLLVSDYCKATGITEANLNRSLGARKIFSVELKRKKYVPAFFLSPMIRREDFAKVIRRLGETSGWGTWDFFTTPKATLGGATPLQFLAIKRVKPVLMAAAEFAKGQVSPPSTSWTKS